jgi:hypothetical protein
MLLHMKMSIKELKEARNKYCHNPNLGLATKARAYKGVDQE